MLKNVPRIQDLFTTDGLEEGHNELEIGTGLSRTFVVSLYPRDIYIGWLDDIFRLGDIDLSIQINPVPDRQVILALTKQLASVQAQWIQDKKSGYILNLPGLVETANNLESLRTTVQTNRDKVFFGEIFITVHATNNEELQNKCNVLLDILARSATRVNSCMFRQLDGFKSVLPVANLKIQDFWRNLNCGNVAACMPINSPELSHSSGELFGFNYYTGSPIFFNQFLGPPEMPNPHILVIGEAGSGKSTGIKVISLRNSILGVKHVFIDVENEYEKVTNNMGGVNINIKGGEPTGINPLDIEVEENKDGSKRVPITDKVMEIRQLLSVMKGGLSGEKLTNRELALIEESTMEEYRERGITSKPESLYETSRTVDGVLKLGKVKKEMPTLSSLIERLAEKPGGEELAQTFKPFLHGGSLGLFDCQSSVNISDTPAVCFNIQEIKDEFSRVYAMFVIMGWVWQKFAQKNRHIKKQITVDEFWRLMKFKDGALFAEEIGRRGRKHNAGLVIGTHSLVEFSGDEGQAVLNSCFTKVIMRQNEAQVSNIVERFSLSDGCKEFIQQARPGECLLKIGSKTTAMQIIPAPFEFELIDTRPAEEREVAM
ncbi:MAG: DUF87 domain-containing protein [Firmicutes bacterium]|nr:DUF87 domain-containing protein [Bacillota bacterium]